MNFSHLNLRVKYLKVSPVITDVDLLPSTLSDLHPLCSLEHTHTHI